MIIHYDVGTPHTHLITPFFSSHLDSSDDLAGYGIATWRGRVPVAMKLHLVNEYAWTTKCY